MVLQAKGHEMEVMAREKALAEALAAPVSARLFNMLAEAPLCHQTEINFLKFERPRERQDSGLPIRLSWLV